MLGIVRLWSKVRRTKLGAIFVSSPIILQLMEKIYYYIFAKGELLYEAPDYKIYIDPQDAGIARRYLIDGEHEAYSKKWVRENIRIEVFYDIGANIGDWSLFVASVYPDCHIYSFEPHPILYQRFKKSVAINEFDNIKAHNFGLASLEDVLTLHCDPKNQGNNFIGNDSKDVNLVTYQVEVRKASEFIRFDGKSCTLIKLDVQGFEYEILKDLAEELFLQKCIFMVEIDETTSKELYEWIERHLKAGKAIKALDEKNKLTVNVTSTEQLVALATSITYFDIVILPFQRS